MMGKTIREAVAELSKDVSYLELSCENDKLKYGIKQLTEENQRVKEQFGVLAQELTDLIDRVSSLPLLLTDDEDSCMVMRRMIDDAIKGNNYEL